LKILREGVAQWLLFLKIVSRERLTILARSPRREEVKTMLYWFLVSAVVAAIAGALGVGVTGTSIGMAQVLLMMVCALVLISLLTGVMRRVR
jgi:uncharacterized membrane protein YtjA (UPF0391 family)